MSDKATEIADRLRGRILRGMHARAVRSGDRLPGSRDLAAEFDCDHRVILAAYRELAEEGLVEMRPRGGIYVSASSGDPRVPLPSTAWLAEIFTQGVSREIPMSELHDWMRRAVETLRLRAAVVQRTSDQLVGLCRELQDYYGLEATGVLGEEVDEQDLPEGIRHADLLITSSAYEPMLQRVADRLEKRLIVLDLRPDLIGGEWRLLLKQRVYVVVRDESFIPVMREFFSSTPGSENLTPLVLGRDPLSAIPEGAPVYITSSARAHMGGEPFRGRVLPPVRLLSTESTRELTRFIIDANFRALVAWRRPE